MSPGDIWAAGDSDSQALFIVTGPREFTCNRPCVVLRKATANDDLQIDSEKNLSSGAYLAVLRPGVVKVGDSFRLVKKADNPVNVFDLSEMIGKVPRIGRNFSKIVRDLPSVFEPALVSEVEHAARGIALQSLYERDSRPQAPFLIPLDRLATDEADWKRLESQSPRGAETWGLKLGSDEGNYFTGLSLPADGTELRNIARYGLDPSRLKEKLSLDVYQYLNPMEAVNEMHKGGDGKIRVIIEFNPSGRQVLRILTLNKRGLPDFPFQDFRPEELDDLLKAIGVSLR